MRHESVMHYAPITFIFPFLQCFFMKLFAALAFLLLVSGASLALTITGTDDTVTVKAGASKNVPIQISDNTASIVSLGIIDAKPWVSLSHGTVEVDSDTKTTDFIISPYIDVPPSTYRFGIVASSPVSGIVKKDIFVRIQKGEIVDIESIRSTGNLVPKGDVEIKVRVRSTKTSQVRDITVRTKVTSPAGKVSELSQILPSIDPDTVETVIQTFSLPPMADEGDYGIEIVLSYGSESSTQKGTFTVARKAIITERSERFSLLLGYGKKTTITNEGNFVRSSHEIENDISPFDALFISGDAPAGKSDGKYMWRFEAISPGEEKSVVYFVDYSPLFILIIAILIAVWVLMFKLRSVRIRKYIMQKKFIQEGEEFTVGIDVRNGTGRKIDSIVIMDFVPSVFEFRHEHGPKPKKKKTSMGTELSWNVKDIYPHEERVLSYKIKPVFGVHGQLSLPPAKASFRHNNIHIELKSFSPRLGMVVAEEEEKKGRFFRRRKKAE